MRILEFSVFKGEPKELKGNNYIPLFIFLFASIIEPFSRMIGVTSRSFISGYLKLLIAAVLGYFADRYFAKYFDKWIYKLRIPYFIILLAMITIYVISTR